MSKKVNFSQITSLLQKFSSDELTSLIPVLFPEVGWEAVFSAIKKNRLSCQSRFIAMTTSALYEATNPAEENVRNVVFVLQFYEKIHHNNQDWHGIRLTDQVEKVSESAVIERNIIRAYRIDARDAEVMIKVEDELIYIMTVEKKISPRGVKYKKPFFFAYNHNLYEPRGFYSPKSSDCEDFITYCCKGMGYDKFEEIYFSGNDVISLFGILERNLNNSRALVAKDFQPVTVIEEDGVADFTLGKEREKYAEDVLTGLTKLQKFSVEAQNEWRGAPYLPDLEGVRIDSAITFTSSTSTVGVEDIFKEMIKRGMVQLPVPAYIANLPHIPKNTVQLTEQEDESNFSDN